MKDKNETTALRRMALFGVLLLGIVIGRTVDWPAETKAQANAAAEKPEEKPKAFLSGSERSVAVLKDISKTLKQIETRVANIERHLKQQAKK